MSVLCRAVVVSGCLLAAALPARAADGPQLSFQTHASFFSAETKQPRPIDPQVFVADAASPAATGPQGIKHAAGFRPALITTDPGSTPLSNADGHALGVTLADWLAATGEATLTPTSDGAVMIRARFEHLRPNAEYSLFENHFDQTPVGFTPLDGTGTTNAFKTNAQGVGVISLVAPQPLTHANAVLVIWDDDGQTHGLSRGDVGVSAQHQLIARPAG